LLPCYLWRLFEESKNPERASIKVVPQHAWHREEGNFANAAVRTDGKRLLPNGGSIQDGTPESQDQQSVHALNGAAILEAVFPPLLGFQ
jgi:hypothetical protein